MLFLKFYYFEFCLHKMNNYLFNEDTDDSMNLAFNKKLADLRKTWLYNYKEDNILDHNKTEVPINDFINKELIHFSNADTLRSIGQLVDGLKIGQRKIMYSCFERKLYKEIRVAQLAGYVSEKAAYHHGEMSLQGTIIGMAQDYVGSNNINLLMPNGQFGTRIMGGNDAASSRYIHTELNKIVDTLYPASDFPLLEYNDDDGILVEPKYYVPIIPMILVNGMNGIGTGFSTSIPKYNPIQIVENIMNKLTGKPYNEMKPWYDGFKGTIIAVNDTAFMSKGKYDIVSPTTIRITELPIGKWTDDYKKFLDSLLPEEKKKKSKENEEHTKKKGKKNIIDYINNSTDKEVDFTIIVPIGFIHGLQWSEKDNVDGIEEYFKLYTTKGLSLSNIHLYNKGKITKYLNINDIIDSFYELRYDLYVKRKKYQLDNLNNDLMILDSKKRFISSVIDETVIINKRKKEDIIQELNDSEYIQVENGKVLVKNDTKITTNKYDYLIRMSIYSFTEDELVKLDNDIDKLKSQRDELDNKTIESIWTEECNAFMKQYKKMKIKS